MYLTVKATCRTNVAGTEILSWYDLDLSSATWTHLDKTGEFTELELQGISTALYSVFVHEKEAEKLCDQVEPATARWLLIETGLPDNIRYALEAVVQMDEEEASQEERAANEMMRWQEDQYGKGI